MALRHFSWLLVGLATAALTVVGVMGCVETRPPAKPEPVTSAAASCLNCHTDYETLKAIADPDTEPPVEGCGGAAPYVEPFDRVYMGGPGFEQFRNSEHGRLSCTECHGGVDGTSDKRKAHSGDFVKSPSLTPEAACGGCHGEIVSDAAGSLHEQGWGQKKAVADRLGYAAYDDLPDSIHAAYDKNCATCHATCGSCHVNRPKAGGGGLYKGHNFQRVPDMRDNCVACHASRGGHAYFGLGRGARPDVHLTQAGFTCLDCHDQRQMHGDGKIYESRYKSASAITCTDCHDYVEGANEYHEEHLGDFDCQVCHSQDYNNCGSCHVGGKGARIPSYLGYKIGMNPIPEDKPYRMALLRRTLAAPDNWSEYGVQEASAFDARPTFNYTTPHNILRWTSRTEVEAGGTCADSCHVRPGPSGQVNRELYLFESDLDKDWEVSANRGIVVDGRLPENWEVD
jgi:hypothetical protein